MDGLMLNIDVTSDKSRNGTGKLGKLAAGKLSKSASTAKPKSAKKLKICPKKLASKVPKVKTRKLTFIRAKSDKNSSDTKVFSLAKHIQSKNRRDEVKDLSVAPETEKSLDDDPGFTVSFVKPKIHQTGDNGRVKKSAKKFGKGAKTVPQILDRRKAFDFETQKNPFERPSDKWFVRNPDRKIHVEFPAKFKVKSSEKSDETSHDSKLSAGSKPQSKNVMQGDAIARKPLLSGEKPRKPVEWSNTDYSKIDMSSDVSSAHKTGSTWRRDDTSASQLGKWGNTSGRVDSKRERADLSKNVEKVAFTAPKLGEVDPEFEPIEELLFSNKTFQDANVHPHLVGNVKQLFGIEHMTVVQEKTIPVLMSGKDALVRSQTGSGKTLAYAVPIMQDLQSRQPKLTRKDGVQALIVLPTRELATQTYECFVKLMRAFTWIVPGLIIGGEKRKSEKVRLRKGITVLIGTPGRLLDHAEHTSNLKLNNVSWLVIDEADRLLDMGYEEAVSKLIAKIDHQKRVESTTDRWDSEVPKTNSWEGESRWNEIGTSKASRPNKRLDSGRNSEPPANEAADDFDCFPDAERKSTTSNEADHERGQTTSPSRQTVLLSATLTRGVERLAALALKNAVHVDAASEGNINEALVIPQSLQQKYVVVPAKLRLVALASYVIHVTEEKSKILIFMATQDMVDYYSNLLTCVLGTSKFYKLHGNMTQGDRSEVFNSFRKANKGGVLLSTDVAARGLNFPEVDWIVQFTAPTTPAEYVHRVGRTARVGKAGHALIFLLPSELHFISMLQSHRVQLQEVEIDSFLKSLLTVHLESKDGRWGGGLDGAATVLQHNFEHAVLDDEALHLQACNAYKSWIRFYATYPRDLRIAFDFKALHLGHMAKSFALRDPPKTIGGIGKPTYVRRSQNTKKPSKRKAEGLGNVSEVSRTKRLITSEFDSGLKQSKRPKFW